MRYPVTFNGHPVTFDAQPTVINGRTFVPFRAIFEKMGAEIQWDAGTQMITATRGNTTVKLTIGSSTAMVNGQARTMDAAPYIDKEFGRTLVPLRFVGEAFGATVNYDSATTAITIVDTNWPKRGGTLNFALWNAPDGQFNPIIWDDIYTAYVGGMIYDGLWRYDERYIPVPGLAEHWEWSENDTKLTVYLRKGVKFHDGTPLTAKDVIFTYKSIWHPKYYGPRNVGFDDVLGYEAYHTGATSDYADSQPLEGLYSTDDYTVVFKLKQPNAIFVLSQLPYGILDSSKYSKVPVADFGTAKDSYGKMPNGTGPFMMSEAVDGQYYVLKANPNFWGGAPYVDRVIWRVVSSDVAVGEMQLGKLDYVTFNAPDMDAYKDMAGVTTIEYPTTFHQMMGFNTRSGITTDKRVRQAINFAIDRPFIIDKLKGGHGFTQYTPVSPLSFGYSEDVEHYDRNLAKANQLLDDAGWKMGANGIRQKDGKELKLRLAYPGSGNMVRVATAPVVQQNLKEIGISVELEPYDFSTLSQKVFDEWDFDMYFIGWDPGSPDPDQTGVWDKEGAVAGGFNGSGWYTARSDELLAMGRQTADLEERMEIYAEWQRIWAEDAPGYIFYGENELIAYNLRLRNFKPGVQGHTWNVEEIWIDE